MTQLPKVAIICANYNYSDYIVAAMDSIVNQTYKGEIRLYVVDDGSTWADIIGVLDADDAYHPEKVEKLVSKLVEHDEVGVAYADYTNVFPDYNKREFKNSFSLLGLQKQCMVHSNALIKKEYLEKVRLPDGEFYRSSLHGPASQGFIGCTEDYDLWLRLSQYCMFCHIPENLGTANQHGRNQSMKMTTQIFQENAKIMTGAINDQKRH